MLLNIFQLSQPISKTNYHLPSNKLKSDKLVRERTALATGLVAPSPPFPPPIESRGEFDEAELSIVSERLLCIKVIFTLVDAVEPELSVLHDSGVTAVAGGKVRGVKRFKWLLTSVR